MRIPWSRLALKWQLMLPFGILALVWAVSGSFLLTRTAMTRAESRIDAELYGQVVTTGTTFSDVVAGQIELERLAAHTSGVGHATSAGRGAEVERLLSPLLVNSRADVVVVLDADGQEVISLWRSGTTAAAAPAGLSPEVRQTLLAETAESLNKSVLLAHTARGDVLLATGAIPEGAKRGRVAVGLLASTLAQRLKVGAGEVALFDPSGRHLASTGADSVLPAETVRRPGLVRAGFGSREAIVGSLTGRGKPIVRIAVLIDPSAVLADVRTTALGFAVIGSLATLGVLLLGWFLARRITRRLELVAQAARAVTNGDLTAMAKVDGADEIGVLGRTFNTMADELEARSRHLAERERHFRSLVQHSSDVIMIVDRYGRLTYQSPSAEGIFGNAPEDLVGEHLSKIVHPDDLARLTSMIGELVANPEGRRTVHTRIRHADGEWRYAETILTNLLDEPAVGGIVLNTRDVTKRTHLEGQLRYQAFHDSLTGLANRALFSSRVEGALARERTNPLAVMFLDLDDFKTVNDSLGHAAGDDLLQAVARRLESCVRSHDLVSRLGGDEFAILVEEADGEGGVIAVAERILHALEAPVPVAGREIVVSASIGIASDPSRGVSVQEILQHADLALCEAKRKGRNRYEPYVKTMEAKALERLELGVQLRRAVEDGALDVHYQPIYDIVSGGLSGFEALSRWQRSDGTFVPPDLFIPLAEETGLIHTIGRWMLVAACHRLVAWQIATGDPDLSMSVNLSVRQLQDPNLVDVLDDALAETGLSPSSLILEITESILMADGDAAGEQLDLLRERGVKLAIDDFGTGYSSLSYIERFPVDVLKVDKSFIDGLGTNPRRTALLGTITALGKALGLRTVAEGVETSEQLDELRLLGFDRAQGYLLGRPVRPAEIDRLLSTSPAGDDLAPVA